MSARYHYLGYKTLVGAQMRYTVHDRHGGVLALLGFSTVARKLAPRDRFIGWTPTLRPAQEIRQAEKGHLAAPSPKRLETNPQPASRQITR